MGEVSNGMCEGQNAVFLPFVSVIAYIQSHMEKGMSMAWVCHPGLPEYHANLVPYNS